MKNIYTNLSILILLLVGITSCSSTRLYNINIVEPAPVFFDSTYKKVGVIDRSEPEEKNKTLDLIDKVLSAEGKDFDKDAAETVATSMKDELLKNNRFEYVTKIDSSGIKTPGLGVFPTAIPWDKLEEINNQYDVEVLFVLSFLDTDSKIDYSTRMRQMPNPLGGSVQIPEHLARVDTRIKTGWRIYDLRTRTIRDEIVLVDQAVSSGRGINPMKAVEAIKRRKENVLEISKLLGIGYAQRVLPQYLTVSRNVYVRGSENLKAATRYLNVREWDGAEELWLKEAKSSKRKVAGRATYNLALISEIDGDLEKAIEWANISYLTHNDKRALAYVNILKNRLDSQRVLEEQRRN